MSKILQDWVDGSSSEAQVWEWATSVKGVEAPSDPFVRDVVDVLESLPYDLITTEDAELMLDALSNPEDEADLSQNLLWNHMDFIDTEARRRDLRDHPFYGPYTAGIS
ncbi:MAG: hypothetical protein AAF513_03585 [Pseudomonadota bacterium]